MSRAVYIGGFGNGRASAEGVATALEKHFEDVAEFTFSDYMNNPKDVHKAAWKAHLITHSAGALALADPRISPVRAELLNPPLVRGVPSLLARTVLKQARMATPGIGMHSLGDVGSVARYNVSSAAELVVHPLANLGNLRRISNFDSVHAAIHARREGIYSRLLWTEDDAYFKPAAHDIYALTSVGIRAGIVPGEHDEVVLRPQQFIDQLFETA